MTLKAKTIIFTTLSIVTLMTIIVGVLAYVLYNGFSVVENDRVKINAERVEQALEVEIDNLSRKVSDWSSWDDTYKYVVDKNKEYEESNLTDGTLVNLDLQMMAFINEKGNVVQIKVHDLIRPENREVPQELLDKLTDPNGLFAPYRTGKSIAGFIMTGDGPFLVASRPILTSNGDGSPHGVIIFARFYDNDQITRLERVTRQNLEMYTVEKLVKNHGKQTLEKLQNGSGFEGITMDNTTVEGYILLKDIYGNPAFPIEIKMDRNIFVQAQQTIKTTGIVGIIGSIAFLVITLSGFTYFVLRPLDKLTHDISAIGKGADMSLRIKGITANDEIGKLSQSINSMLQSIEYSGHLLSEERIRSKMYIDIVGTMIIVMGPTGDITLVNKKACEVLRANEKDIIGKNWFDTFIPEQTKHELREKFTAFLNNPSASSEFAEHNNTIRDLTGTERLISWHNTVLKNADGQPIAIISTGEDITELHHIEEEREKRSNELEDMKVAMLNILEDTKNLEEKVKTERDRATAIISSIGDGLFVIDTTGVITMVNSATCKMLGVHMDNLIGKQLFKTVRILHNGSVIPTENRPLAVTLEKGASIVGSLDDDYAIQTDYVSFPIGFVTTALYNDNTIIGALMTFHDVTRDKQIKDTIERTVIERTNDVTREQARLMASINNLSLGFIMTDIHGKVVLINDLAKTILASSNISSMDDIVGLFQGKMDIGTIYNTCKETKTSQRISSIQYDSRWVRLFIAPVITQDEAKDLIGVVLVLEDNTESKVMERSKDEFFSIASHELRTPLTAIRGNTSMIMDFYGDKITDPDLKEMITDIHASSLRLIDIVNDFLNVSRLEQGKIEFKNTNFDLRDLAIESVKEFEGSALEKKVAVRFEDLGTVPLVFADRDRTKQAMLNLVGNSLKFTENGEVVVHLVADGDMVRCRVTDTGRGISKDNQNLLFRKFQQAGSSLFTRDTTKGTGLGLYISRLIIEGMGGKIWLEKSQEGVGSEFCFTLPIQKQQI